MLLRRGCYVIDADEIGHEVLEPGGEAFERVAAAFPDTLVDGTIDRGLLARDVFADPTRLRLLESLTHPAIRAGIRRDVEACGERVVVVEVPLISDFLGDGWLRVVVDVPTGRRLQRLLDRGLDLEDVRRRIDAQPSRRQWRDAADFLVDNSGDLADLEREVERLWSWLNDQCHVH